ncbi:hypothetical protein KTE28_18515 [Burkholderia multivorans]|uniref:hypothetical protein n=1 Tax=Burkholderia multivorans TaxID=87883 RepID=UPI0011B20430|nr:hypothetical protein [Burkholderia multivorans]MBU9376323.1 hypothetical protein [Burkholderia multivorans]HEF4776473.1 hypothetical protein [Burkholderia multivorans]HEF4823719.1 hypothetical protein [Burkholderia multivorans]
MNLTLKVPRSTAIGILRTVVALNRRGFMLTSYDTRGVMNFVFEAQNNVVRSPAGVADALHAVAADLCCEPIEFTIHH